MKSEIENVSTRSAPGVWFSTVVWHAFAILAFCVLGLRAWGEADEGTGPVWTLASLIGVAALMYVLFLLEGLQVAALRLRSYTEQEREQRLDEMRFARPAQRRLTARAVRLLLSDFDSFVVGRQLCVLGVVVSITLLILQLRAVVDPAAPNLVRGFAVFANSYFGTLLPTTFITCWVAQLPPQFLADREPERFLQLVGAQVVGYGARLVDAIGLGLPAYSVAALLRSVLGFSASPPEEKARTSHRDDNR